MRVEVEFKVESLLSAVPMSVELTLRVLSMVEEPETKMPAVVEVGVSVAWEGKAICQAPGLPDPPPPQAPPDPATSPFVSTCRHWVEPVMVLMVRAPATVVAPFSLVVPSTERVVEGAAVPIPT